MEFIVYALPRSRTKWLSEFLSYGNVKCLHEITMHAHTLETLQSIMGLQNIGICDTGLVEFCKQIASSSQNANVLVIRRDVKDVAQSLLKFGIEAEGTLNKLNTFLDMAEKLPRAITINYSDLDNETSCKRAFEHCLGVAFDSDHWEQLRHKNIQVDMQQFIEEFAANYNGIENLKKEMGVLCQ
jgi:hypothetical protein